MIQLPASGYKYRPKRFPLPKYVVYYTYKDEEGKVVREVDAAATEQWAKREEQLWREVWRLPQAVAWHMPQYQYLHLTVAMYVRQFVICENPDAKAADRTALARYADTIGMTPQGLKLNSWAIYDDRPKAAAVQDVHAAPSGKVIPFPDPRDEWENMQ